ncbi:MAG: thermonuclease family protein [Alphaproteobacteria bacterium]|nr:thermonuclease family protein [Alphaproteobacteria bacterium]
MARLLPLLALIGCYRPPTLPLIDEVPIVPSGRCASPRNAFVACVIDGDTFDIGECGDGGERIRMLGIDAPEIAHPPEPAECWADNAHTALRQKIEGKNVFLTFDEECTGVFGRTLAYAWLQSGSEELGDLDINYYRFINVEMVQEGHAYIFEEEFGDLLYREDFVAARDLAQALGIGLWGACEVGP